MGEYKRGADGSFRERAEMNEDERRAALARDLAKRGTEPIIDVMNASDAAERRLGWAFSENERRAYETLLEISAVESAYTALSNFSIHQARGNAAVIEQLLRLESSRPGIVLRTFVTYGFFPFLSDTDYLEDAALHLDELDGRAVASRFSDEHVWDSIDQNDYATCKMLMEIARRSPRLAAVRTSLSILKDIFRCVVPPSESSTETGDQILMRDLIESMRFLWERPGAEEGLAAARELDCFTRAALDLPFDTVHIDASALRRQAREAVRDALAPSGLDVDSCFRAWAREDDGESARKDSTPEELGAILFLESKEPGASAALQRRFGIHHFSRYWSRTLLRQFRAMDRHDRPCGVLVFPEADWNGAFGRLAGVIDRLCEDAEALGYDLRITEAGSTVELARRVLSLRSENSSRAIEFAVIGGHGTPTTVQLGRKHRRLGSISREDVIGSRAKKLAQAFVSQPEVLLLSCSTGESEAIAARAAQSLDWCVTAPDGKPKTNLIERIRIQKNTVGLRLVIEYEEEDFPWKRHDASKS